MFGNSHIVKRSDSNSNKKLPHWRILHLAAALTLSIGSAGQATAAQASPVRSGTAVDVTRRFYFNFNPPSSICVGQSFHINVTTLVDESGTVSTGQTFQHTGYVVPGVTIKAKVDNPSIATLDRPQGTTGILPDPGDLLAPGAFGSATAENATVVFTLTGKKPGTANLTISTTVPAGFGGGSPPPSTVSFVVAYCRYRVVILSNASFFAPNLSSAFVQSTIGDMEVADRSGESNTLQGTADTYWYMTGYSWGCSHDLEITDGPPSQLTGAIYPLDHTLKFKITYSPFHLDSINCASQQQGDWTNAELDFNIPDTGGTFGLPWNPVVGQAAFKGQLTIRVWPLPSN